MWRKRWMPANRFACHLSIRLGKKWKLKFCLLQFFSLLRLHLLLPFCWVAYSWHGMSGWLYCVRRTSAHSKAYFANIQFWCFISHPSIDLLLKLIKMYEMLLELLAIDSIQIVCMKFCRIWRNQCFISRKTILFYNINFPGSIHIFFPPLCVCRCPRSKWSSGMSDMKEQQQRQSQQKQWTQPDLAQTRKINDTDARSQDTGEKKKLFST